MKPLAALNGSGEDWTSTWTPDVGEEHELYTCPWDDDRLVLISPSRKHPGFYYIETHHNESGVVDSMRRPIKQEALGAWLDHMLEAVGPAREMRWERCPVGLGPEFA